MIHQLEQQYLHHLDCAVRSDGWAHDTTGRNGAKVLRALDPPRFIWNSGLELGFPLLTSKRMAWRAIVAEFCWMISGRNDIAWLKERGAAQIWQPWALPDGTIGRGYGYQIGAGGRHLVAEALSELRRDPSSRRACYTHWVADDLAAMALPPCHGCFVQLRILPGGLGPALQLHMYQRSADWCVGVPFNLAFYALLLKVCAQLLGVREGRMHIAFGDAHMYEAHRDGALKQVLRAQGRDRWGTPGANIPSPPRVIWTPAQGSGDEDVLRALDVGQFQLLDYAPLEPIRFGVAV